MAVKFININKSDFLEKYKRVYRFTNIERFIETLNSDKFIFINPSKWPDPFEKFYLERDFQIDNNKIKLPAKDKLFSVCVSGTSSSEAFWKVYAPKEDGIRLTFDTEKLLDIFLDKIENCDVYIGKVNYLNTKDFYKTDRISADLIKEIENSEIGEQQIQLLLRKRSSFRYEDEIRIIVVPHGNIKDHSTFKVNTDIKLFTIDYTIDPRLGKNHVKLIKDYFAQKYGFKVSHSRLYAETSHDAIILR